MGYFSEHDIEKYDREDIVQNQKKVCLEKKTDYLTPLQKKKKDLIEEKKYLLRYGFGKKVKTYEREEHEDTNGFGL